MEELALISLLAEVSHPVFADHRTLASHVSERTVAATRADSVEVELTQSSLVLCRSERESLFGVESFDY